MEQAIMQGKICLYRCQLDWQKRWKQMGKSYEVYNWKLVLQDD